LDGDPTKLEAPPVFGLEGFLAGRRAKYQGVAVSWSREDDHMLRMGIFWGDTAEEIARILDKDVLTVLDRAIDFGLPVKRLTMLSSPSAEILAEGTAGES
jgi:hypothetical protein